MEEDEEKLLTQEDIAERAGKSVPWVRKHWLKSGLLRSVKVGGNGYRVRPVWWVEFIESGNTGFRHASTSGRWHGAREQGV